MSAIVGCRFKLHILSHPKLQRLPKYALNSLPPCKNIPNPMLEYESRETISEYDETENYKIAEERRRYKANIMEKSDVLLAMLSRKLKGT